MSPVRRQSIAVPLLVAVVGIALVVAAVGLSGRPSFALPRHAGEDPNGTRDWAIAIVSILVGVLMIRRGGRFTVQYQRLTYRMVGSLLIVGPGLLLNLNRRRLPTQNGSGSGSGGAAPTGQAASPTPLPSPSRPNRPGVLPDAGLGHGAAIAAAVLVLAAVGVLGIAAYRAWLRRPARPVDLQARTAPVDPAQVLDDAAGAIALGGSPRDRVIAAFEAMEAALGSQGMGRARQQAPLEWLAVLARERPGAVGAANALAAIFERARFSDAAISESDAADAAARLRELRAHLGVRV